MSLNLNIPSHDIFHVKQINLHHCKSATALISNALHMAQTKKERLIVLIQEPHIYDSKIQGFDLQACNIFYHANGSKPRACIVATKDVSITLLPQFCDGDTTSVVLNTGKSGLNEDINVCSAYLPGDSIDSTPGRTVTGIQEHSSNTGLPLLLGCDANAHHVLWGSSNINKRGSDLAEFLVSTDLEILNKGKEPTFLTKTRKEVLDVTFASNSIVDRIENWHVSPAETLSDHREINFSIKLSARTEALHRNPRKTNWDLFNSNLTAKLDGSTLPAIRQYGSARLDGINTVKCFTPSIHSSMPWKNKQTEKESVVESTT